MDITTMLNNKGGQAAAAAAQSSDQQLRDQLHAVANGHTMSETASDRGVSPHGSEHSRYSGPGMGMNGLGGMNGQMRYPSPTAMQGPLPLLQGYRQDGGFESPIPQPDMSRIPGRQSTDGNVAQKAFPCSTCDKGFARRSDLARHERIHSGVRPHVCDYPGCNKQFIQRSALTVHGRVHTGEKPHMCERCGKPFSDSSSLARHRRIHSGKRPYKCPYADCQKTFTRRTTLTRHQNHHTGTVEEAAAATAAALATRSGNSRSGRQSREDGQEYSQNGSPMSTPSPGAYARTASMSPHSEASRMAAFKNHPDFRGGLSEHYLNNSSLPVHLRPEYMQNANQPTSAASAFSNGMRPTSHPTGYGPPPTLEPPANPPSAGGSPHMSSVGWHSPSHMPSPTSGNNSYVYPDPDPYNNQAAMGHMFYPNTNIRRPQSTEPESYDEKPRINDQLWAGAH